MRGRLRWCACILSCASAAPVDVGEERSRGGLERRELHERVSEAGLAAVGVLNELDEVDVLVAAAVVGTWKLVEVVEVVKAHGLARFFEGYEDGTLGGLLE